MMKVVALKLSDENYTIAEWHATDGGYFGVEDGLQAILNTELVYWRDRMTGKRGNVEDYDRTAIKIEELTAQVRALKELLREEMAESTSRKAASPVYVEVPIPAPGSSDLDDDIPF